MEGWKLAGWSAVCGMGALAFLRIVACEIERTDRILAQRQAQAAKALERGRGDGVPVAGATSRRHDAASQRNGRNRDFVART